MTTKKQTPKKATAPKAARKPRARREETVRIVDLAKATNLALAGATYKQIASELEVDEETVRYQLLSPEGQRALRFAVNDLQERTDRFLASAHLQALRRLVREMEEAAKPGDRIRAAQAITMLAARRIEITGANGAPIEVDTTMATLLDERISRMRERSRTIIDATVIEDSEPQNTQNEPVEAARNQPDLIALTAPQHDVAEIAPIQPELIDLKHINDDVVEAPEAPEATAPAPTRPPTRTRQPAGLRPGQGIRAIR